MGWVVGNWSCLRPQSLRTMKPVHPSVYLVASARARWLMNSAKDSLSHRSFHHFMVTRSPNHMCASSCSRVRSRSSRSKSLTFEENMKRSCTMTRPMFSIAPELYSGANTWSYLAYG